MTEGDRDKFADKIVSDEVAFLKQVPPTFKKIFKDAVKEFLLKQAATGQIIEFQAMRLVKDPARATVTDLDLEELNVRKPDSIGVLKKLIPFNPVAGHENLWVKGKFNLDLVNNDDSPIVSGKTTTWKQLYAGAGKGKELKKGMDAVQPDLMTYKWQGPGHRPVLKIFELKVGDGENKKGEHEQLMRLRRLFDGYIIPHLQMLGLPPQYVPDIKLYFCAWKFGVKDPTTQPKFTPSPYDNNTNPYSRYYVKLLAGAREFGTAVGIDADAIEALLQSFEIRRYMAVGYALSKFQGNYSKFSNIFKQEWEKIGRIINKRPGAPFAGPIPLLRGGPGKGAQLTSAAAARSAWSSVLRPSKSGTPHISKPRPQLLSKARRETGRGIQAMVRTGSRMRVSAARLQPIPENELVNAALASPHFSQLTQENINRQIRVLTAIKSRIPGMSADVNRRAASTPGVQMLQAEYNALRAGGGSQNY
jgi:hypothetical protein